MFKNTLPEMLVTAFTKGAEWAFEATGINEGLTVDEKTALEQMLVMSDEEQIEWHKQEIARLCAKSGLI